jgi:hypothetical protein
MSSLAEAPRLTTREDIGAYDPSEQPPQLFAYGQQSLTGLSGLVIGGSSFGVLWTGSRKPEWLDAVARRLSELMRLPRNWDSYGGVAVKPQNATRALSYLARILEQDSNAPWVVPLSDGGVQLEWHQADIDLEIAFSDAAAEVSLSRGAQGIDWEGDPEAAVDRLRPVIAHLRASA